MPKTVFFVLGTFFSVMIFVTIIAYSRKSGNTGMDMAKIHQIRARKQDILTVDAAKHTASDSQESNRKNLPTSY